jgi:hypothetical protein
MILPFSISGFTSVIDFTGGGASVVRLVITGIAFLLHAIIALSIINTIIGYLTIIYFVSVVSIYSLSGFETPVCNKSYTGF